jgi:hypothetical protein
MRSMPWGEGGFLEVQVLIRFWSCTMPFSKMAMLIIGEGCRTTVSPLYPATPGVGVQKTQTVRTLKEENDV